MNLRHVPTFSPSDRLPAAVAIRRNDETTSLEAGIPPLVGTVGAKSHSAYHGVVLTGPDRIIRTVNAAFTGITGYSKADMVGQTCRVLQGPLTDPRTLTALRRALIEGTEFTDRILNYRKDGSTFWNHLSVSPVRNPAGAITYYIGIVRDLHALNGAPAFTAVAGDDTEGRAHHSERQIQAPAERTRAIPLTCWPGTWIAGTTQTWVEALGLNLARPAA